MSDTDNFLNACKIKIISGKKYYYIDTRFSYFDGIYKHNKYVETYIAPVDLKGEPLQFKLDIARFKLLLKSIKFHYDMSEKHYTHTVLNPKELKRLSLLRLAYSDFLYKFNQSDMERYEQAAYTKYVYGTTSIEGNTYTLRETDLTLNEGITIGGKEKREFYEIENYNKLQTYLKELKESKFDEEFTKKLHSIILCNIDDDSAGSFRKVDVGIRGSTFEPIPAVLVPEEIKKLFEWFNENADEMHFLEIIAIFHQRFEEIHPFKDGNGRVGRELVRIWLSLHDIPTIFIDKTNREIYLKCLDAGNNGDHKPLIKFFYDNLMMVHDELIKNAQNMIEQELTDKTHDARFQKILNDKKVKKLLSWLAE